jgi:DNA repair ATPase RecN
MPYVKPTKVKYDESDNECESDDEKDYSKEELIDMCDQLSSGFVKKRKECKALQKELKALKQSFEELQASHECLKEDHEELGFAHTKLEKAHSSLLEQVKMEETKKAIMTYDKGSICDLINESFLEPIIVASTNPSCSTFTSTSSTSNGFTYDTSLMVENETLKEVNELTHALGNAYGGVDRLLMCLGIQRASLNKEGLGYILKKSKATFAPHKTSFVKNNNRYCTSCK